MSRLHRARRRARYAAYLGGVVTPPLAPLISFSLSAVPIAEGDSGTKTVTHRLNVVRNGVTGPLVANLAYTGTATAGSDYIASPASVTIPAGQDYVDFTTTINGDTVVEPDETIIITATLAAYPAAIAIKTITIGNDDAAPGPTIAAPYKDWRAVTSDVTDGAGVSLPAFQAQQATKATKARGASFSAPTTGGAVIYKHIAAHTQPLWLTWIGTKQGTTYKVEVSRDAGATWVDQNHVLQKPGTGVDDRRQLIEIAPGLLPWIRLTGTVDSGAADTIQSLLFEKQASGVPPVVIGIGNSVVHYHMSQRGLEAALMAARPDTDPLFISWGQPAANMDAINNSLTAANGFYGKFVGYAYAQGLTGSNASSGRPYTSSQGTAQAAVVDSIMGKISGYGWLSIMENVSFRPYNTTDNAPYVDPSGDQQGGSLPYNVGYYDAKVQTYAPGCFDADYQIARGFYAFTLWHYDWIGDGTHPSDTYWPQFWAYHATSWYRWMNAGTWGAAIPAQVATTAEASLLQVDYQSLVNQLTMLPATSAKAALSGRRATLLPLVLLKTANLAVVAYETTKAASDKMTAQTALQAAKDGGASAADVATAYGVTVNLTGTGGTDVAAGLNARIAAVFTRTVYQRIGLDLGNVTPNPSTFNSVLDTQSAPLALLNTAGAASGVSVALSGFTTSSTQNGIAAEIGTSPNNISASNNKTYIGTGTNGIGALAFTGGNKDRKYRLFLSTSRSGTADRSMTFTATGNGQSQTSAVVNGGGNGTTSNTTGALAVIDNVVPNSDGSFSVTTAPAGANTGTNYVTGVIIEEYTS